MPVTLIRLLAMVAMVAMLVCASAARAGCSGVPGGLTFAGSSSYDVRLGTVPQATGQAGLSCSGSFLSVAGGSYANATVTSANNFRLVSGNDSVAYQASADAAGKYVYTQGSTINYFDGALLAALGGNASSFNAPIYGRLTAAANLAAGTYQDTLTVTWNYSVCDGVQVTTLICAPSYTTGRVTLTIVVTMLVSNDCRISAPDINFGSAALLSQLAPVSSAVLVSCTKGTAYSIAFSRGAATSARPWRTMSDGAGHSLQYNIYLPDGVTIWDETNPQRSASSGTGDTNPATAQPYIARINPSQSPPKAGSYADTLSVIISF